MENEKGSLAPRCWGGRRRDLHPVSRGVRDVGGGITVTSSISQRKATSEGRRPGGWGNAMLAAIVHERVSIEH